LNAQNAPFVVRICQRLDGIPLALELAAAQIRALGLDEIAARLEQHLELRDAAGRHARQQTLRALMDWSYELLDEVGKLLLARLAVFAGGWTLEQATVVAGGYARADVTWQPLQAAANVSPLPVTAEFVMRALLNNLVSKSLVIVESGQTPRYRFLETIREYARERAQQSGDWTALELSHYEYFAAFAARAEPELHGKAMGEWLAHLDSVHAEFRIALSRALQWGETDALQLSVALGYYWRIRSFFKEGYGWLEASLNRAGENVPPGLRAQTFFHLGEFTRLQGNLLEAKPHYETALALAREVGDYALFTHVTQSEPEATELTVQIMWRDGRG